jgi:glycosyltransferase involved in cell wall biosynthesis
MSSQASNTGSTLRAEYIHKYLKKLNRETYYIKPPFKNMPFMLDFVFSMFYNFFKLMNMRCDYVIIVKPYPNTVLPALLLKSRGAKIIIDIDDLDHGYRQGFLSGVIRVMQASLIKYADILTTHNTELRKMIIRENPGYKGRTYMLNQCVDREVFNPRAVNRKNVKDIRRAFPGKKILFYMAHLNIASYLEDILESLRYINDNAVLLVAGGGPALASYVSMARRLKVNERTVFLGQLPLEKAAEYIAAADLCLVYYKNLPVNTYRASMKLREYLAMGKNVAADAVGDIKNFRDHIFLSRPDPESFAKTVNRAIKSIEKKGEKGYKLIFDKYDWKTEITGFYKILCGGLK